MGPDVALLEIACLVGGSYSTLLAAGVVRGSHARGAAYDAWYERYGRHLKLLGPVLLLGAVVLPNVAECGPYGSITMWAALVLALAVAVYIARTWRREPAVPWPRGVIGVLAFAVSSLTYGGILAGIVEYCGVEVVGAGIIPCLALGIAIRRTLDVWRARFHAR